MTFLLGLVAGLIVGWVIEWIIDWQFWRAGDDHEDGQRPVDQSDVLGELDQARLEIADLRRRLESAQVTAAAPASTRDNLQQIKGIGPVFSKRLNAAGIFTFSDLAATSVDKLQEIIGAEGRQRADLEGWIAAAVALASPTAKGE